MYDIEKKEDKQTGRGLYDERENYTLIKKYFSLNRLFLTFSKTWII